VVDERTAEGRLELAAAAQPATQNGLWRTTLTLSGEAGAPLASGDWRLRCRGESARLDAWIGEVDVLGTPWPRFLEHHDPGTMVGPPATAAEVLAVGAFHHRTGWTDADGASHPIELPPGALALFSTRGPTRDGRLSPTLAAPGVVVASSLSADADPRSPASLFYAGGSLRQVLPDGRHALASGTSMAAPFAAGGCALLLEAAPGRTGAQIRALFELGGAADADTGRALFEAGWGFGKADAARLLGVGADDRGLSPAPAEGLCGAAEAWIMPSPHAWLWAAAQPRDAAGIRAGPGLDVRIEAEGAVFDGPVIDRGDGLYLRLLTGEARRGSELLLRCSLSGEPFEASPRVRVARSHAEANDPGFGQAGGCAQAGPCGAGALLLLAALGLRRLGASRRG